MKQYKLSELGIKMLENEVSMPDEYILLLEIVGRAGGISKQNACDMADEAVQRCGSPAEAVRALRDGRMTVVAERLQ